MVTNSESSDDSGDIDRRIAVGKTIKLRRKELGLTQPDVASRIEKSVPTISKIEAGRHPLDIDTLSAVARALDTTLTRLLWECEKSRLQDDVGSRKLIPVLDRLLDGLDQSGVKL